MDRNVALYRDNPELHASNAWYAISLLSIFADIARGIEPTIDDLRYDGLSHERKGQILDLLVDDGAIEHVDGRWCATPYGLELDIKLRRMRHERFVNDSGVDLVCI